MASGSSRARDENRRIRPVWLFPTTYALHLVEEYVAVDGFPAWARHALGVDLSQSEFVLWNAFGFASMCVGAALVGRDPKFRFVEIAMAVAVLGNAAAHAAGSIASWSYSPGLLTGIAVWTPLGWIRARSAARAASRRGRVAGICIGVVGILFTLGVLAFSLGPRD